MKIVIEDEYLGVLVEKGANHANPKFPLEVIRKIQMRFNQLREAKNTSDLRKLKSLHFEKLSGDLKGKYSIRVTKAYRMIFRIGKENMIEILFVEEVNNHYS